MRVQILVKEEYPNSGQASIMRVKTDQGAEEIAEASFAAEESGRIKLSKVKGG